MDWRRLHRPPRGATAATIVSALGAVAAIVLIYASLLGFGQVPFTVAMYIAVVAILLAVWAWWRRSFGVFAGNGTIRITTSLGTMLFASREIAGFAVRRDTLWIVLTEGAAVKTSVARGRRGPDRPSGLYLSEPVFDAMMADLAAEVRPRPGESR